MKKTLLSLVAVGALISGTNQAMAQIIVNPDFSDPTLANGQYTTYLGPANTIPGWMNPNIAGVENFNGTGAYTSPLPSGPNAAYDDGGTIYQDLTGAGSKFALGSYTLTVYSGWRIDKSWPGGSLALFDATTNSSVGSIALVQPAQGGFTLTTLNVPVSAGNVALGDQIRVELISNGNSVGFDNVALSFTPSEVPEPSTFALMMGGLAVLVFYVRRKVCR